MTHRLSLQMDFRRPPTSRWRRAGWAVLAVAVAAAAAVASAYSETDQAHSDALVRGARLAQQDRGASPRRAVPAADPQLLADLRSANTVIDQLTIPWDELFDAIESAGSRDLGLLALTPNARDRSVRLAGEALSIEQVLAYVDRLAAQPALSRVHLLGYNAVQRDGVSAVAFTLAATWRQSP